MEGNAESIDKSEVVTERAVWRDVWTTLEPLTRTKVNPALFVTASKAIRTTLAR